MSDVFRMAVVGVGRIGAFHARHVQELAKERGDCALVAVADEYADLSAQVAGRLQKDQEAPVRAFASVEELIQAEHIDGAFIASRTADHCRHAHALIEAGHRVLLEKPLTHSLESAREFAAYLEAGAFGKTALMQAFMRRFDAALLHAKKLLDQGAIGAPFKIVSVLEDPLPPPPGYSSAGLLADMSVHNIDEILWLSGRRPRTISSLGAVLYNQKITSVKEDFDDGFLQMWFPGGLVGQVQVSRNHVAGYRNETWIYGDEGLIHVGAFQEDPLKVFFAAYGRGSRVIEKQTFALRDYGEQVPVFIERFGLAYKAEVAHYIDCCRSGAPFGVDHRDGLRALEVVEAAAESVRTQETGARIQFAGGD
jgi:myo-inositol 2-dehydrogenase/D-chiro-inositol 1-dehydrogenase